MFSEPQTRGTFIEDSFSEMKSHVFDVESLAASDASIIQAKLNRRLGPEYVSQRPAPGGGPKLTYVEGWKIIGLANEVFGFNGWCSTVTKIETDFIDMDPESRRYSIGVTALVKITLKDGTYHEDIGYGTGDNLKSKGVALDKAKKEAVTDGVKRALRNFGNLLGLCLYEKSFTQEVVKIKPQHVRAPDSLSPRDPKFDESDLHRRDQQSASALPTASSAHDLSFTSLAEPLEDMKHVSSIAPQVRSAVSRPSPLRNAISSERALKASGEDERGRATGVRTGVGTTVEPPAQSKHQIPDRSDPQDKTRPRPYQLDDRPVPPPMQPSHQGSSSERNVAVTPSHRQFDMNAVRPPLKVSDSDPDIYFNDEDNDILLAIEDSAMQGVESSVATMGDVTDRDFNASRDATRSESSGGTGGKRPQIVTASVMATRSPASPLDQPMSNLRRAIRASTSLAASGVKRPAEVIQSQYPQSVISPAQQQQRSAASSGMREPLKDLPVHGGPGVKRIKR